MTNKPTALQELVYRRFDVDCCVETHQLVPKRQQIVPFRELRLYWGQSYPIEYLN